VEELSIFAHFIEIAPAIAMPAPDRNKFRSIGNELKAELARSMARFTQRDEDTAPYRDSPPWLQSC
jgi:hypothetical protein